MLNEERILYQGAFRTDSECANFMDGADPRFLLSDFPLPRIFRGVESLTSVGTSFYIKRFLKIPTMRY